VPLVGFFAGARFNDLLSVRRHYGKDYSSRYDGFLADFDPFGKQEFTWTPNAQHAWVFASHKSAMAAMRWLPRDVKQHAFITKKKENMNSSSS
jgi:hypothetical protein